ncbi:MAG TPA: helix-turn-helix domain-containing protein, partial [Pirellulales bacterium]
ATEETPVDVRVVAATNADLERLLEQGRFRSDLYYRLAAMTLAVPPLRDRPEDLPLLLKHFLSRASAEAGKPIPEIEAEARACLMRYRWPGNVRELHNVVERAVLLGKSETVQVDDLPPQLAAEAPLSAHADPGHNLKQAMAAPEKQIILEVLERHNWNRQATSEELGINRTTLYKKMKRLGLEDDRYARH